MADCPANHPLAAILPWLTSLRKLQIATKFTFGTPKSLKIPLTYPKWPRNTLVTILDTYLDLILELKNRHFQSATADTVRHSALLLTPSHELTEGPSQTVKGLLSTCNLVGYPPNPTKGVSLQISVFKLPLGFWRGISSEISKLCLKGCGVSEKYL